MVRRDGVARILWSVATGVHSCGSRHCNWRGGAHAVGSHSSLTSGAAARHRRCQWVDRQAAAANHEAKRSHPMCLQPERSCLSRRASRIDSQYMQASTLPDPSPSGLLHSNLSVNRQRRDGVPPDEGRIVRGDLKSAFGPATVARFDLLPPQSAPCSLDRDRRPRASQHQHSGKLCTCAPPGSEPDTAANRDRLEHVSPVMAAQCRREMPTPSSNHHLGREGLDRFTPGYGGDEAGKRLPRGRRHGKSPTFLFNEDSTRQQLRPRVGMSG